MDQTPWIRQLKTGLRAFCWLVMVLQAIRATSFAILIPLTHARAPLNLPKFFPQRNQLLSIDTYMLPIGYVGFLAILASLYFLSRDDRRVLTSYAVFLLMTAVIWMHSALNPQLADGAFGLIAAVGIIVWLVLASLFMRD